MGAGLWDQPQTQVYEWHDFYNTPRTGKHQLKAENQQQKNYTSGCKIVMFLAIYL